MRNTTALILAAGQGTRMKSAIPKVMHKAAGQYIIQHVIDSCEDAEINEIYAIIGHGKEMVKQALGDRVGYIEQEQQLGTGHALMMAIKYLPKDASSVLVLVGDAPLINGAELSKLLKVHEQTGSSATVLTASMADATGYGRIVTDHGGQILRIVEEKDATNQEKAIREINSGMYCFKSNDLIDALGKLKNNNVQGEYYLTDVIGILHEQGKRTSTCPTDAENIKAVNTRVELAQVEKIMRRRINEYHMDNGVTILDPDATYIGKRVAIGQDTIVYPGTILEGNTIIGETCQIMEQTKIIDCIIGDGVVIQSSTLMESTIGDGTKVGPYAYIRPNCKIGKNAKVGDFVEMKNARFGDGSKASHLTYVGDAVVGKNVNLGCGVVFVNYDGVDKHITVVEDDVFIGCNVNLISPVTVRKGAYIAAGSTITEEVPEESLAIARMRQLNKEGYYRNRSRKKEE